MEVNYYIEGQLVQPPLNSAELGIELNYDSDSISESISLSELTWGLGRGYNDGAFLINQHKNGTYGVFQGVKLEIEITNEGTSYNIFDGYMDTASAIYSCNEITLTIIERGRVDWFNSVADSKTFSFMFEKEGIIKRSDFVQVPYVLSTIPNNGEAFMALLSIVFLTNTILNEFEHFKEAIAKITSSGHIAFWEMVALALRIVYFVGLIILLVATIKQMIDALIQPIKYHAMMTELKLCQRACESFGLTFASSILENTPYKDSYILPTKYAHEIEEQDSGIFTLGATDPNNLTSEGYLKGTFGDLLTFLKKKYNAKIVINDKKLRLERKDYNPSSAIYQMPSVIVDSYRLNAEDFVATSILKYDITINNKHTMNNYNGAAVEVFTGLDGVLHDDMTLTKGFEEINLGYSRVLRKTELTFVEEVIYEFVWFFDQVMISLVGFINLWIAALNLLISIIEGIISLLNFLGFDIDEPDLQIDYINYTPFSDSFGNRISMMMLENDFVDIPANVIIELGESAEYNKVSTTDEIYTNAEYLYDNYHYINSFVPTSDRPNANQYIIKESSNVPFCFESYEKLRVSNKLFDEDGKEGLLITGKFNIHNQTIDMEYKINELYTDNLKQTKIVLDGK